MAHTSWAYDHSQWNSNGNNAAHSSQPPTCHSEAGGMHKLRQTATKPDEQDLPGTRWQSCIKSICQILFGKTPTKARPTGRGGYANVDDSCVLNGHWRSQAVETINGIMSGFKRVPRVPGKHPPRPSVRDHYRIIRRSLMAGWRWGSWPSWINRSATRAGCCKPSIPFGAAGSKVRGRPSSRLLLCVEYVILPSDADSFFEATSMRRICHLA